MPASNPLLSRQRRSDLATPRHITEEHVEHLVAIDSPPRLPHGQGGSVIGALPSEVAHCAACPGRHGYAHHRTPQDLAAQAEEAAALACGYLRFRAPLLDLGCRRGCWQGAYIST